MIMIFDMIIVEISFAFVQAPVADVSLLWAIDWLEKIVFILFPPSCSPLSYS